MQPTNYHSVMEVADKEQLHQLLQASLQQDQDLQYQDQDGTTPYHNLQDPLQLSDQELQAALEDDLTELTASNWVQGASPHNSHSRGHSSGVDLALRSYAFSSNSTDAGSSTSSRHLGFFQAVSKDPATATARAKTLPARPKTAHGSPQHQSELQDAAAVTSPRPLTAGTSRDQQRQWLQFQQPEAPDAAAADILRRASSAEGDLQAALQQQGFRQGLLHSQTLPATASPRRNSWQSLNLQDNTHARSAQHASTYAGAQHEVHIREPAAIRQAVARLSLDGGGRRLTGGLHGYSSGRHSPSLSPSASSNWLTSQSAQGGNSAPWQAQEPAGPEEAGFRNKTPTTPRGSVSVHSNRRADFAPTEGQLLLLQQLQRQQQLGESGRSVGQGERPASTPPFLQDEGQRYGDSAGAGSSPTMLQAWQARLGGSGSHHGLTRPQSPGSASSAPLPAAFQLASPAMLSPEAAAAAEEAAASIQLALAAVDTEMQQLKLLQALNKQRVRLQAHARAAVTRAAAAAAASVAASAGPGPAAVLFAGSRAGSTVGTQGRLGSLGSLAGTSSSTQTNSSAFSSSSLLADGGSGQDPWAAAAAAMPLGPLPGAIEQQQQQQQQRYYAAVQRQLRRSEPGGGYGSSSGAGDAGWAQGAGALQRQGSGLGEAAWGAGEGEGAGAMQRHGSLSPKALWSVASSHSIAAAEVDSKAGVYAGAGHVRRATWSDLPGDFRSQQMSLGQGFDQGRGGEAQRWDGQVGMSVGVDRQGGLQEAAPGDVQHEMQQLAMDATQLARLQQMLQMLRQG